MSTHPAEKVGVVVIHGVGVTYEGWSDAHLVPELEKWVAYDGVRANARKPRGHELLLRAHASDGYIVVSLDSDEDFKKFCFVAGLQQLAIDEKYRSRDDRLAHRDELVYVLESAIATLPASHWISGLRSAGVPTGPAFDPESEVHRVRDPDSTNPMGTWKSFTRRWTLPERNVLVTELFWADLSQIGNTNLSRIFALVELLLESPWILGRAFLRGSEHGIHRVISWLISTSNWIMRWPIAGLNVAVFATAFLAIGFKVLNLGSSDWHVPVIGGLIAVVVAGLHLFRAWVHRKIGLADLALAGALSAAILLALLATYGVNKMGLPRDAEFYLTWGVVPLLAVWIVWTVLVLLSSALVALVGLKRLFVRRKPHSPPLARPAAAIGLGIMLGMLWKFFLALVGVMVIANLNSGNTVSAGRAPHQLNDLKDLKLEQSVTSQTDCPSFPDPFTAAYDCTLETAERMLFQASALNLLAIVLVLAAILSLVSYRGGAKRLMHSRATAGALTLPRLIAHPLIIFALFTSAWLAFIIFVAVNYPGIPLGDTIRSLIPQWVKDVRFEDASKATLGLIVFSFFVRRLADRSGSVVHIGRDLVDHQYDWRPRGLPLPAPAEGDSEINRYRRRKRIQRRLEALIDEVIARQRVDRLIFLAHSQGTVILHDYLVNHDNLVRRTHAAERSLFSARRIDVVTMGSPLKHIYRYYFPDYDQPKKTGSGKQALIERVDSWTNMWRVDDPIGQDVQLASVDLRIENIGLGPGGHTYYWREDPVCAKIWSLITLDTASSQPAAQPATN